MTEITAWISAAGIAAAAIVGIVNLVVTGRLTALDDQTLALALHSGGMRVPTRSGAPLWSPWALAVVLWVFFTPPGSCAGQHAEVDGRHGGRLLRR